MDEILTTDKVALIFGVTRKTIQLWFLQGLIKAERVGKRWYCTQAAVDAVLGGSK